MERLFRPLDPRHQAAQKSIGLTQPAGNYADA